MKVVKHAVKWSGGNPKMYISCTTNQSKYFNLLVNHLAVNYITRQDFYNASMNSDIDIWVWTKIWGLLKSL